MNAVHAIPLRPDAPPAPALVKLRNWRGLWARGLLFAVMVLVPVLTSGWYLGNRAAPQFASRTSFAVRTEQAPIALDMLSGLGALTAGSSSDADVVVDYLQSQSLIREIGDQIDLAAVWSAPLDDPLFAYHAGGTIEDLWRYSRRMIRVRHNAQTGLISLEVRAFDAATAQTIAAAAMAQGAKMLNALSDKARADATRDSELALERAQSRLRATRQDMAAFRAAHRMLDPAAEAEAALGVVTALQGELAQSLITLDLLQAGATNPSADPRIAEAERRVAALRHRIEAERAPMGDPDQARVTTDYEGLAVDLEFAEAAYVAAMTAAEAARAEADRQNRYLAAHIPPTRPERAEYPRRAYDLALIGAFAFMAWAVVALIWASLGERRRG